VLAPRAFTETIDNRHEAGALIVFFLASFKPISTVFGIPGAKLAGERVSDVVARLSPSDAIVGSLSWLSTGVFLPGARTVDAKSLVARVTNQVESEDLEIQPAEWAELRLAVGLAAFNPEANATAVLQEAANLAELDQAKFPEEWRYPVVIADD
jgi:GGDEF domain-containing protein